MLPEQTLRNRTNGRSSVLLLNPGADWQQLLQPNKTSKDPLQKINAQPTKCAAMLEHHMRTSTSLCFRQRWKIVTDCRIYQTESLRTAKLPPAVGIGAPTRHKPLPCLRTIFFGIPTLQYSATLATVILRSGYWTTSASVHGEVQDLRQGEANRDSDVRR